MSDPTEPEATTSSEATESSESAESADAQGAPEDIKAKFREALEKKQARGHRHNQAGPSDSKADGEHSRADHDKTFRRKSG